MSDVPPTPDPNTFAQQLRALAAEAPTEDTRSVLENMAVGFENQVVTTYTAPLDATLVKNADGDEIGFLIEHGNIEAYTLRTPSDYSKVKNVGSFERMVDAVEAVLAG